MMDGLTMTLDRLLYLAYQGATAELDHYQRSAFHARKEGDYDLSQEYFSAANCAFCDQQELFQYIYGDYPDKI